MRSHNFLLLLIVTVALSFGHHVYAQDDATNQQLAKRIVRSAGVKEGDVVMIDGGRHMVPLMETIAIEVQMTGGMPIMFLESDRVARTMLKDVPDKYLEQVPRFYAEWLKHANVYIGLPSYEDPKSVNAGIPAERFAKFSKTNDFFAGVINSLPIREVDIDFPTKAAAEINGMEFPVFQKVMFDGINADYEAISAQGSKLQTMLQSAKQIRITSPSGTDLAFSMAPDRGVYLDDGIVTGEEAKSKMFTARYVALPGGSVYFAPLETSANGKVVIPRMRCRYNRMNNVTFEFKDGRMQNFKAASQADCFQEIMNAYTGPKDMFGSVWFGLNPSLRNVEDDKADLRQFNTAGMVHIGIGDNRQYGGVNNSNSGYTFPITNATVTVDGKTVIKDGKLVL